jgi:hypothetical protein
VAESEPAPIAVYDPSTKHAIEGEIVPNSAPTHEASSFKDQDIRDLGRAAVDPTVSATDFLDGLLKANGVDWNAGTFTAGSRRRRSAHRAPEAAPVQSTATESASAKVENELTPERFDAAAAVLTTAMDNMKNGLSPNVASIDQLQAALRDVTEQNAEGMHMVMDIERIREAALELKEKGDQQGRQPNFMDMMIRYDRLYRKALRGKDQARAAAILQRKELTWLLTDRGGVDILSLFAASKK